MQKLRLYYDAKKNGRNSQFDGFWCCKVRKKCSTHAWWMAVKQTSGWASGWLLGFWVSMELHQTLSQKPNSVSHSTKGKPKPPSSSNIACDCQTSTHTTWQVVANRVEQSRTCPSKPRRRSRWSESMQTQELRWSSSNQAMEIHTPIYPLSLDSNRMHKHALENQIWALSLLLLDWLSTQSQLEVLSAH